MENTETFTLAILAGTSRVQRESIKAAHYIDHYCRQRPRLEVIFVDPNDFDFPGDGNDPEGKDPRYGAIVEKADAFFVIVPEYNHGYPGTLKRMIDSELAPYNHKPVAIAGVSNGSWGGVRAVQALVPVLRECGLVSMSWDVYFPRVQDIFDADGVMHEEHRARYDSNVGKLLDELLWFAGILKAAR